MTPGSAGRWIEVRLTKALLVLHEEELLRSLPRAMLVVALRRGKRLLRARRFDPQAAWADLVGREAGRHEGAEGVWHGKSSQASAGDRRAGPFACAVSKTNRGYLPGSGNGKGWC